MAARQTKPKWRPGLVVESGLSEAEAAISLGLRLLTEAACGTWADLMDPDDSTFRDKAISKVSITADQGELLDRHLHLLSWLVRAKGDDGKTVATGFARCPSCGEFTLIGSIGPSVCKITSDCRHAAEDADGNTKAALKPVKIKPATRQKEPTEPLNTPSVAPVETTPVQSEVSVPARDHVEVTSDGLVRAKPVVFGDDIDDEPIVLPPAQQPEPLPAAEISPVDDVDPDDLTEDF